MGHNHTHGEAHADMPFHEKAHKLIDHWVNHNNDHASEYRRWASTFREHAMDTAAEALEAAAALNAQLNAILDEAKQSVHSKV